MKKLLYAAAVCGQLLALFPFVCVTEGAVFGGFIWWHYAAVYAVLALFWAVGRFTGAWAAGSGFSPKKRAWAVFASRAAVVLPAAAFVAVSAALRLPTGLYLYTLPACLLAFFGGHHTVGMSYSDVFARGWFALYFAAALIGSGLFFFTRDEQVIASGRFQLCAGFGALIVLSAVLANQTNIDSRTAQRAGGSAVLPNGLRGYNAGLIAAVCAAAVGLFLFAKPCAAIVRSGITAALSWLLSLIKPHEEVIPNDTGSGDGGDGGVEITAADGALANLLQFLLVAAAVFFVIRFRKQIWALIKELCEPLFKENALPEELPFVDEVFDAAQKGASERERRKTEQQLLRRYKRETDPTEKYRLGYALFLARLARSPFPQAASDTTTIHRQKGGSAFRREEISGMVSVYNEVRYGGRAPDENELAAQERLIEELR